MPSAKPDDGKGAGRERRAAPELAEGTRRQRPAATAPGHVTAAHHARRRCRVYQDRARPKMTMEAMETKPIASRAMKAAARSCAECGKTFKGAHLRCPACRASERTCDGCGETFKGTNLRCPACRASERACDGCGRAFRGTNRSCTACQQIERTCDGCGETFKGHTLRCSTCQATERACDVCGNVFTGTKRRCPACRPAERICEACGTAFRGTNLRCMACQATERTCDGCGETFRGTSRRCMPCWRKSRPLEVRQALDASHRHTRRARKLAADVFGPVPPEAYQAIRASGPCVYCAAPASAVDHIRPLSRGGWEHESNLVPACGSCNCSKNDSLLTEWNRADRVAHGVAHSPKVAMEYQRNVADVAAAMAAPGDDR